MSKPKIDLTKNVYGRLTVLEYVGGGNWRCLCDCGNICIRSSYWMRKGKSKSCGCLRQENLIHNTPINLIGKKFGKLIVINPSGVDKFGQYIWLCKCDCGNIKNVLGGNLRNGYITSCNLCSCDGTIVSYDDYYNIINFCEETRRNPENEYQLQVKCTNCNNWFNPLRSQINNRIRSLNSINLGESRFYCSIECKKDCPIYNKKIYKKGTTSYKNNRPGQKEWADLVKERDNYKCQICGSKDNLVAHHYEGLNCNPIESWDLDNGVTLCKDCHLYKAHKQNGCRFIDMQKIKD